MIWRSRSSSRQCKYFLQWPCLEEEVERQKDHAFEDFIRGKSTSCGTSTRKINRTFERGLFPWSVLYSDPASWMKQVGLTFFCYQSCIPVENNVVG